MKFCYGDYIDTTINLFTEKGIVNINSFKWMTATMTKTPSINFLEFSNDHNKLREVLDFDLSRFCELEIMKNKWNDLSNLLNNQKILNKIKIIQNFYRLRIFSKKIKKSFLIARKNIKDKRKYFFYLLKKQLKIFKKIRLKNYKKILKI